MHPQSYVPTVVVVPQSPPASSQALPALCNFFCFPGLGQLIQGRILAAVVFWCAWLASLAACLIVVGFVLAPIVYLWAIIDAAKYKPSANGANGAGVLSLLAIGVVLVALPIAGVVAIVSLGLVIGPPPESRITTAPDLPVVSIDEPIDEPIVAPAIVRDWTSADGKFTTTAALQSQTETTVVLEKANGAVVTVAIDKLSAVDQEWLREHRD